MPSFSGNTSTSAISTSYDIPSKIKAFSLVNKSGSTAIVSVSILYGSTNIFIYKGTINAGESYVQLLTSILLLATRQIYVLTNQNIDYNFTIE